MNKCEYCGNDVELKATRVSIWGMFDNHTFEKFQGNSVDEVIENWMNYSTDPENEYVKKFGAPVLCPAIVLNEDKELRRVGKMVHNPTDEAINEYKAALMADPDISKLLLEETE